MSRQSLDVLLCGYLAVIIRGFMQTRHMFGSMWELQYLMVSFVATRNIGYILSTERYLQENQTPHILIQIFPRFFLKTR